MLIASSPFTTALAPHAANRSWIVFLQCAIDTGVGPVKIEGMRGATIGARLRQLCADNPYELIIIGLIATDTPNEHAVIVANQFASTHLHDGWFSPSTDLLTYIQRNASAPLQELIAQVQHGAISEHVVDIDDMAKILGVSARTVRRMVKTEEIPFLRFGQNLRFEPRNVLMALRQRR